MTELFGRLSGSRPPLDEESEDLQPDAQGAKWLRRRLAGGVVAVTTTVHSAYRATTITSCTSVSIDPPQFLISLELDGQMEEWLQDSQIFGLNILPWNQQFLADQFAGFTPLASAAFKGIDHFVSVTGAPLLAESIAWADCRVLTSLVTGDHRCFVGEAVALGRGHGNQEDPLLYYLNRYRRTRETP